MTVVDMKGQLVTHPVQEDELAFTRCIADDIHIAFEQDANNIHLLFNAVNELEKRLVALEKKSKSWWRK